MDEATVSGQGKSVALCISNDFLPQLSVSSTLKVHTVGEDTTVGVKVGVRLVLPGDQVPSQLAVHKVV